MAHAQSDADRFFLYMHTVNCMAYTLNQRIFAPRRFHANHATLSLDAHSRSYGEYWSIKLELYIITYKYDRT